MSKRFSRGLSFSVTVVAMLFVGPATASWAQYGERYVAFRAVGPGGLGIEGKGSDVSLREQGDAIVATVGLGSLATGIELRDKHMREKYLETAKYPVLVFTIDKSKVKSPFEGDIDGNLKLHGVTQSVRLHYKATGTEKHASVVGSTKLNMKDFNIAVPSYLGVSVKPDVTVTFKLDVEDR